MKNKPTKKTTRKKKPAVSLSWYQEQEKKAANTYPFFDFLINHPFTRTVKDGQGVRDQIVDQDPGLRFNKGKVRHDLLPPFAMNEIAKVFTQGAEKYGDNNWQKGMKWTKVIASLKRHLNALERGEDFDDESKLYHAAHLATNAIFLQEYYKIAPHFDNRPQPFNRHLKIGFDIDGVLADFDGAFKKFAKINNPTNHWFFSYEVGKQWKGIEKNKNFWLDMPCLVAQDEIMVEPDYYVTHRPIPSSWSEEWIEKNNLPCAPVITVTGSKVDKLKELGIQIFVDDKYENFVELNNAGIFTYLYTRPYNARYRVGHRRLNSLKELTR